MCKSARFGPFMHTFATRRGLIFFPTILQYRECGRRDGRKAGCDHGSADDVSSTFASGVRKLIHSGLGRVQVPVTVSGEATTIATVSTATKEVTTVVVSGDCSQACKSSD
jgi:hypothetical protein